MPKAVQDAGASKAPTLPVTLICGEEEFSVKQRARQLWEQWCRDIPGMDHEILEASAGTVDEALHRIAKVREALQTLPFFGGDKLVWFRDCTFLGEDRTGQSATVTEALAGLAEEWKSFNWQGLRLLVSAGKPDKRRAFFKTLDKLGTVEHFASLSDEKDWADRLESEAVRLIRSAGKRIQDEALGELVGRVGPNLRALHGEIEKLLLYVGEADEIPVDAVRLLTPLQKQAEGFALGEAVGDRDLVRSLKVLDEELWTIRAGTDKRKSEIGVVYGLISKFRLLLLVKELRRIGRLRPARDYNGARAQLASADPTGMPTDKRFSPLAAHPFSVFQAMKQVDRWEIEELVRAMDRLLEANVQLVASGLDEAVVLQRLLIELIGTRSTARRRG